MNLLVVSSWFPYPPNNGSKLRAYHLLRELSKRHIITLLSFAGPDEEQGTPGLSEICRVVKTVPGSPFKTGGSLGLRGLFSSLPRSYLQTYSPAMQDLVDRSLIGSHVAVGLQLGAALYLANARSVPRIFEEAEVTVLREQFTFQRRWHRRLRYGLTWWKFARFMRRLTDGFDATTVVSELERNQMIRIGCDAGRIAVISNGVNPACLHVEATPQPATLIYPGALTYWANYDAILGFLSDVFPLIRRVRPDVTLQVTGSTDGVRLDDLPNQEGVIFTGYVSDIDALIAQSTACIVPLRGGGGTRLKIIQSMALGTPVISTSKGAEGLAVAPEESILIGDTPQQFADQVLRLLADPTLRTRLSHNGRRLIAQSYTWDQIGTQLDALLSAAMNQHANRAAL
ncbi:MAG TPA: glycosyltransferase family 4 protein [Anaerolineae bacterium]